MQNTEEIKFYRFCMSEWSPIHFTSQGNIVPDGIIVHKSQAVCDATQVICDMIRIYTPYDLAYPRQAKNTSFRTGPDNDQMEIIFLCPYWLQRNIYFVLQYNHNTHRVRTLVYGVEMSQDKSNPPLHSVRVENLRHFMKYFVEDQDFKKINEMIHNVCISPEFRSVIGNVDSVKQLGLTL